MYLMPGYALCRPLVGAEGKGEGGGREARKTALNGCMAREELIDHGVKVVGSHRREGGEDPAARPPAQSTIHTVSDQASSK